MAAADGSPTRRAQTQHAWNAAYKEALEYDAWGQVEEAVQCYHRLQVATSLESSEDKLALPAHRRAAITQLAAALKLRMLELNSTRVQTSTIGLAGMQSLSPFVAGLIMSDVQLAATVAFALKSAAADSSGGPKTIASSLQQLRLQPRQQDSEDLTVTAIEQQDSTELKHKEQASTLQASSKSGTLRAPALDLQPGDVTLSVSFVSWSAKGAEDMEQPHVLLTVRDRRAKLLDAVQESPQVCVSRSGAPDKLDLDFVFHLQTPLNCLPEDAAVFMELRHWKAGKKKMSVKCYAMLPYEELLRPGAAMLALYKKPTDFKARGQRASYTSQPMYVHIIRTLTKH